MDQRKQEVIDTVNTMCTEKRRVLEEQHSLIESEKNKVCSYIYSVPQN